MKFLLLQSVLDKYEEELQKLGPLYEFFQASFPDGGKPAVPPPCPE